MTNKKNKNCCPDCDKVFATDQDFENYPPGAGDHLCWRAFTNECMHEPIDWCTRCSQVEDKLAEVQTVSNA